MKPEAPVSKAKGILQLVVYSAALQKRAFVLIILTLLISGILEGIGIVTLFPLLQLVVEPSGAGTLEGKYAWIATALGSIGLTPNLETLIGVVLAGIFGKAIFLYWGMRMVTASVSNVLSKLRSDLVHSALHAGWPYFQSKESGTLVNRLTNETQRAGNVFYYACQICANIIQVAVYALLSLYMSWQLTLVAGIGAMLVVLFLHRFVTATRIAGKRQAEVLASISAKFTDYLQGIKPLKAMGMEGRLESYLQSDIQALNLAQQEELRATESMKAIHEPVMVALIAGIVFFCIRYAPDTVPSLLTLAIVFQRLLSRTNVLQLNFQNCASGEHAFWWVLEEISRAKAQKESVSFPYTKITSFDLNDKIELRDIHFSHGEKKVLQDVSLTFPAKGFVLLRGPSGAGKTSLIDIICRLQQPDSGKILVDGAELSTIPLASWRAAIGYVPQEMFLLNDSLVNNLTLGDDSIPQSLVEEALRLSGSFEFVSGLPGGIHARLGERGTSLSGGQRQRISLARALVRRPRILILDEVTASLDPKTEQELCDYLKIIAEKTCVIAISHQQAFIQLASKVYSLSEGKAHSTA